MDDTEMEKIQTVSESLSTSLNSVDLSEAIQNEQKFLEFESFSKFYEGFSNLLKETVGVSNKVPIKPNEIDYYLTCPSFKSFYQAQNERVLKLIGNLLKQQNIKKTNISSNKMDDEERMDMLVDSNDQLIEKLGIQLDEIQGLRKKTETELKFTATNLHSTSRNINTSWNKDMGMVTNKSTQNSQTNNNGQTNTNENIFDYKQKIVIQKPQKLFNDKIDNSHLPFVPKIRKKPNALRPLSEIFEKLNDTRLKIDNELFEKNLELLENPYAYEIEQFEPDETDITLIESIQKPIPLDEVAYKYIDSPNELRWLCELLGKDNRSKIKEIAVDLEHHSYRSFLGFTCLMQISTRTHDFLIDTIKLRSEMHILNEIFTDWTLLKVFHGADFDIEWLQKDFGIYVVNMFDTGQASRILQYPHFSLSYLLQRYCNVNAQKQFQLADWRVRPLNDAMIRYAREDTHYLLYIYDELRNELVKQQSKQANLNEITQIKLVYEKSKLLCKKVYRKPIFYSKGFLNLCQYNSHLNPKQTKALHDLYTWRDKIARESDESCEYVLKSHQLLKIAELLPREIYGILALCNPISNLVESNVHEMHEIIKKAREYKGSATSIELGFSLSESEKNLSSLISKATPFGLAGFQSNEPFNIENKKTLSVLDTITHTIAYDPDSVLNCPHDLSHTMQMNSETMEREEVQNVNAIDEVSKLELKEILLKSNNNQSYLPPTELKVINSTKISSMFTKNDSGLDDKNETIKSKSKKREKLIKKIKLIKESTSNPFEVYLPVEFRSKETNNSEKWNFIVSSNQKKLVSKP